MDFLKDWWNLSMQKWEFGIKYWWLWLIMLLVWGAGAAIFYWMQTKPKGK